MGIGQPRHPRSGRRCALNAHGARLYPGMRQGRVGVVERVVKRSGWLRVLWDGNISVAEPLHPRCVDMEEAWSG